MDDTPLVVYVGPDATEVGSQWSRAERPFALEPVADDGDVASVVTDRTIDCLVTTGERALDAVVDARDAAPGLPVVAFDDGDLDPATALGEGVSHLLDGSGDRVAALEALAPTVEQYRADRRERTMLDSLLENIPLSVYFKDRKSRHVKVSDDMTTMIGAPYIENPEGKRFHTAEDVAGTTDFDLYPPGLAENAVEDDRQVIEDEEPVTDRVEHAFGTSFDGTYVATSKAPWYDEHGTVAGVIGITRDISERKQYENRLERQNERLERFAEVISHDLRNPLEVARARLSFAREDGDPEHFEVLERSLDRMDELIGDVLALARQGETVDDPEAVALATVARDAWAVVDSGDATLRVETDHTVEADPGRLAQVLENLFRNAVEHGSTSPASQAQRDAVEHGADDALTVTVGDLRERRGFYVADDGVGIPEDERGSVFDAGYSTGEEGTGLGLNIVRTIADAHGWHVTVTESDGGGASFHFEDVTVVDE